LAFCLSSCASPPSGDLREHGLVYSIYDNDERILKFAPVFIVEEAHKDFNLIGTAEASKASSGEKVYINPRKSTIYTSIQKFSTEKANYTNLFYRVHFSEIPSGAPFYLGAGKNVGLIVVVTLDEADERVLYTMVHSCGCYLAFIPTNKLDAESLKKNWDTAEQNVYGERLPGILNLSQGSENLLVVQLRTATHRIKNVWFSTLNELQGYTIIKPEVRGFEFLEYLPLPGGSASFYEEEGSREGYVKGSHKIWERLFISWWALDWRVGEDKKLGRNMNDGPVFYTSLKPWARQQSDMRDFAGFLRYWGWQL